MAGHRREIGGLYFNQQLQRNSLYPDLRAFAPGVRARALADLVATIDTAPLAAGASAQDFAHHRWGATIADAAAIPSVEKLYRRPARELDPLVFRLTGFDRVVLFDPAQMTELMKSDHLRARLAFPEQRELPAQFGSGRASFYPNTPGMDQVVAGMCARLVAGGCELLPSARVTAMNIRHRQVERLTVATASGSRPIDDIGDVIWAAGLPPLVQLTTGKPAAMVDRGLNSYIYNVVLDRAPDLDDLYFFYCYQPGYLTMRLSYMENYCPGARHDGQHRVCLEVVVEGDSPLDAEAVQAKARQELESFGVLAPGTRFLFEKLERLNAGIPLLTMANVARIEEFRQSLANEGPTNVSAIGALSEPGVFFQKDVLVRSHERICAL